MEVLNYILILVLTYLTLKYKRRSERDLFTNVYHKQFLFGGNGVGNKLIQLMKRVKSKSSKPFAMLFIDLDNFKKINDTQGHAMGDEIILKVVEVLRNNTRQNPFFQVSKKRDNSNMYHFIQMALGLFRVLKVDHRRIKELGFNSFRYDWVVRFGGDEFLLILKNIGNTKDLENIAEKILKVFREQVKITASIGGSVFSHEDEINEEVFMKKIDDALYTAKDAGRNCVRVV